MINANKRKNHFDEALVIQPQVSLLLVSLLSIAHLVAVLVLFWLPLAWWVLLMLSGMVTASLYIGLRRYVFMKGAKTVSKLIWDAHGTLKLFNGTGKELDAELCRDTFVCHWLIILNLRTRKLGYHCMVILPDALPQETMRQLRVRVRLCQTV